MLPRDSSEPSALLGVEARIQSATPVNDANGARSPGYMVAALRGGLSVTLGTVLVWEVDNLLTVCGISTFGVAPLTYLIIVATAGGDTLLPVRGVFFTLSGEILMRFSKLLLLVASFTLAACASVPKGSGSASDTKITADEIVKANVPTAYEAIDRLHRQWFQDPSLPQDTVVVYLSTNEKLGNGGKEDLRQLPAEDVQLIEYLQGSASVMRFGQAAKGGAIVVTRK